MDLQVLHNDGVTGKIEGEREDEMLPSLCVEFKAVDKIVSYMEASAFVMILPL